jgi:hypothetical protein
MRVHDCTSRFEPGRVSSTPGDSTNRARLGLHFLRDCTSTTHLQTVS